jgi:excinuclease ABC subunit C
MASALLVARDRAVEATDFEQAAYLHKRLERVKEAAATRDSVIGNARQFSGIALTPALAPRSCRLWPMFHGHWQEPLTLDFSAERSRVISLDQELRENLSVALSTPMRDGNALEHLAIFSRWYYSSWREGQWFPFRMLDDLNYRKLVREISKMAKDHTEVPPASPPC